MCSTQYDNHDYIYDFIIIVVLLIFIVITLDITQQPKTTVALNGSNITFICVIEIGGGVATSVIFNDTFNINNVNRSEYGERGIYWECEGKPKTTFHIYILAYEVNNGTSIFCGFGACTTEKAYLIVVTGKLQLLLRTHACMRM